MKFVCKNLRPRTQKGRRQYVLEKQNPKNQRVPSFASAYPLPLAEKTFFFKSTFAHCPRVDAISFREEVHRWLKRLAATPADCREQGRRSPRPRKACPLR